MERPRKWRAEIRLDDRHHAGAAAGRRDHQARPRRRNSILTSAAMSLPPAIRPKLQSLLLLLSSPVEGERLAATAAIERVLKANGADWHDLVESLTAESLPPSPPAPP